MGNWSLIFIVVTLTYPPLTTHLLCSTLLSDVPSPCDVLFPYYLILPMWKAILYFHTLTSHVTTLTTEYPLPLAFAILSNSYLYFKVPWKCPPSHTILSRLYSSYVLWYFHAFLLAFLLAYHLAVLCEVPLTLSDGFWGREHALFSPCSPKKYLEKS